MLRLALQIAAALGLVGLASSARAEDEVRIALVDDAERVELRGSQLALFDGLDGRRLWAFGGRGTAELRVERGMVRARGVGRASSHDYGRAERMFGEADGAVQVGDDVYFGRIEIRVEKGRLVVLNRLPLETYLLGIVGSEMPATWPIEALKAQAVAARTYALQRVMMSRSANRPHDLAATVVSQVYKGAANISDQVIEAVQSTRGEVLAHDRMLIEALFHSTCGGRTVASVDYFGGARDYLVEVPCTWCTGSSRHHWGVDLRLKEVERRLVRAKLVKAPLRSIATRKGQVWVKDGRGRRRLDPRDVRRAIGWEHLYSERFSVVLKGGVAHFEGRGFGHGVGLCQWGARGMADEGRGYRQILQHYYKGAKVRRIY